MLEPVITVAILSLLKSEIFDMIHTETYIIQNMAETLNRWFK